MNSARFRQARLASGMSLRELSEFLNSRGLQLSHAALHKYETGSSRPTPRALFLIAEALGTPAHSFLREPAAEIAWMAYRRHSTLAVSARERIAAIASRAVEHRIEIEQRLAVTPSDGFPRPRRVESDQEVEALAVGVRQAWGLGAGPIESVTQAIEDHGGVVVEVQPPRAGFDGLCGRLAGRRPVIVVAERTSPDRRRFTLAHELGHLAMDATGGDSKAHEKQAHRFAGAFLVPADAARRELGSRRRHLDLGELRPLKTKYGLSIQAWMHRALDLQIITPTHHAALCRQVSALGWRRAEPGESRGESGPTRLRQMLLRGVSEGVVAVSEAEEIMPGVSSELVSGRHEASSRARSLLKSSRSERDQALARGAQALESAYRPGGSLREFEALSAKDTVDDSSES